MTFTETNADDLRRRAIAQTRQQFAEWALAGFRRPVYAGVFQKLNSSLHICELLLDGYRRNLIIRLKVTPCADDPQGGRKRYVATIQRLPPFLKSMSFELGQQRAETGQACLKGALDFGTARLELTVLSHRDLQGADIGICVLEILRPEGEGA